MERLLCCAEDGERSALLPDLPLGVCLGVLSLALVSLVYVGGQSGFLTGSMGPVGTQSGGNGSGSVGLVVLTALNSVSGLVGNVSLHSHISCWNGGMSLHC